MYLLDTNVVSELRKIGTGRADNRVTQWLANTEKQMSFLSVITVLELEEGVRQLERRDKTQGPALCAWLSALYELFDARIIEFDVRTALLTAPLSIPDPMPQRDAMIAGTALAHGLTVATRNTKDFERVEGLVLVNPWQATSL